MKQTEHIDDPAMSTVRALWADAKLSGMTQEQLGISMGYDQNSARKSVNQFFKSHDPRISMLRRFAKAMGVSMSDLIRE